MTRKTPPPTFGARLAALRGEAGLSVAALAEASGVGRTYLHDLEADRRTNPGLDALTRLAAALGVSLSAFDGCAG